MLSRVLDRTDLSPHLRALALRYRGLHFSKTGENTKAVADLQRSVDLNPTYPGARGMLAEVLDEADRNDEALKFAEEAVALRPNYYGYHAILGLILQHREDNEGAVVQFRRASELNPYQQNLALLAQSLFLSGEKEEALRVADRAADLPGDAISLRNLAEIWASAGERDKVILYMRKALDAGYASVHFLRNADDPKTFGPLRGDPEFEAIIDEVKRRTGAD